MTGSPEATALPSDDVLLRDGDAVAPSAPSLRRRVAREAVYVLVFYAIYTLVRNQFGSAAVAPRTAFDNAERVIGIQRSLGFFVELDVQRAFLGHEWFLRWWNVYYGTFHFAVTIWAMVLLFLQHPQRYRVWRTVLMWTTGLALVGFASFPLMPPRLLDAGGRWGWDAARYPFVDTLAEVGGLWSFDSGGMQSISNQYAAMPSLHIGWSLWCALALSPVLRRRWARALLVAYPPVTLFAIIVTANHYWLDAVGGVAVLCLGYVLARLGLEAIGPRLAQVRPRRS